jgi:hypothetical protein
MLTISQPICPAMCPDASSSARSVEQVMFTYRILRSFGDLGEPNPQISAHVVLVHDLQYASESWYFGWTKT